MIVQLCGPWTKLDKDAWGPRYLGLGVLCSVRRLIIYLGPWALQVWWRRDVYEKARGGA